jgi:hypothetical protein
VGIAVVEALAAARGVAPADVREPLSDSVDPDALDRLFAFGTRPTGPSPSPWGDGASPSTATGPSSSAPGTDRRRRDRRWWNTRFGRAAPVRCDVSTWTDVSGGSDDPAVDDGPDGAESPGGSGRSRRKRDGYRDCALVGVVVDVPP